ncbi:MAG: hypothetical protein EGR90_04040 [Lachnospiraceae bacterium]|nr:hypothetical protein [Lachnospiraceae bacterium]
MATQEEREAFQRRMKEVLKGNNMYLPEYRRENRKELLFLSVGGLVLNCLLGLLFGLVTLPSGNANFARAIMTMEVLFGIPTALAGAFIYYHPATEKYAIFLSCASWFTADWAYKKYGIIFAVLVFIFIASLGTTICKLIEYKSAWNVDTTNDINILRNYQQKFKDSILPFIVFASIGAVGMIAYLFL